MRLTFAGLLIVCAVMFSASLVLAQNVSVHFVPVGGVDLTGALLSIQYESGDLGDGVVERMILTSNTVSISVPEGEKNVLFIVDFLETPTKDYFGEKVISSVTVGETVEVLVFPIGYVQGRVVDSADNLIGNANLLFECSHGFTILYPLVTDSIGGFRVPNMPVGTCHISASLRDKVGSSDILIERGKVANLDIILTQDVRHISWFFIVGGIVLGVLLIGGGWYWFRFVKVKKRVVRGHSRLRRKKKYAVGDEINGGDNNGGDNNGGGMKSDADEADSSSVFSSSNEISSHTSIILQTLSEKEKMIVEYLISCDGTSSAATIRHACHIPRTSLLRIISGLERKKLVSVEKMGKMVKVTLTSLFLGKLK